MMIHPTKRGKRYMLAMSVGALGIVYGDIGTSPLYAFRESFHAANGLPVDRANVFGVLSLMFWAMVLIVSVKYLIFVMSADNHGEGGILALTALIVPRRRSKQDRVHMVLILGGLFGTALLYGDGIITPAISVLSAVEGIGVATPALTRFVVPIAVVILIGLFSIQRAGTSKVGAIFGPVMIVWFSVLAILGGYHILQDPGILTAINPVHAAHFVAGNTRLAFLALGAIFLVVTGSEALYADMGHFGKRPIRIGWYSVVFPALLLNYFGQGAMLISNPSAIDNPFYRMSPEWAVLPMVVLATMATVIASQALISGAYSLTMQAVQLGYLPRFHIDHTSPRQFGQVYISTINWSLMVACVGLVIAFGTSSDLAAAYGVAVTTTMVITTILLFYVMRERWRWSRLVAVSLTTLFLAVDLSFFAANIVKVPAGGWFPLAVGGAVFILMLSWKRGRAEMSARLKRGQLPIERFIGSIIAHPQVRVPGTAVYLFPNPGATPPALLANLRHNEVIHETVVLVAVETASVPRMPQVQRATVHELGEGFVQVVLHFGFMDEPNVPRALSNIVDTEFGFDAEDATYFLGRETIINTENHGIARIKVGVFSLLHRNASTPVDYFDLPPDQVIEIGTQLVLEGQVEPG
jgi:KUP system potassium uptake protein